MIPLRSRNIKRGAAPMRRLLTIVGLLTIAAACEQRRAPDPAVGQWIWTARDSALFIATREQRPTLRAAVWVATLARRGDSLVTEFGRPIDASLGDDTEAVIRIDDSFSALWSTMPVDAIADRVAARLTRLLPLIDPTPGAGHAPRTIQLDYDAPMSKLGEYAQLIARLRAPRVGVLRDRGFWVTSLVAHLADPRYGERLRPFVDGHIVQLFDTGDRYDARAERNVLARLERAGLPFRVGLGAFERQLATGATTHRAWFAILPDASQSRWYQGCWIFPAGTPYLSSLPR